MLWIPAGEQTPARKQYAYCSPSPNPSYRLPPAAPEACPPEPSQAHPLPGVASTPLAPPEITKLSPRESDVSWPSLLTTREPAAVRASRCDELDRKQHTAARFSVDSLDPKLDAPGI